MNNMKPADAPDIDYKKLVREGYNACAEVYDQTRRAEAAPELDLVTGKLEKGARVLDIGCGAGVPVSRALAAEFSVTGVDISEEMVRRARKSVPEANFIVGDVMSLAFPEDHFSAVTAFYSIFHLPREEHPELFRRVNGWLKPGGLFLGTVSLSNEAPYTEDDFFDVTMYWSNYSLGEYEEMLSNRGFKILETTIIGHGYNPTYDTRAEKHPLIFAQKTQI